MAESNRGKRGLPHDREKVVSKLEKIIAEEALSLEAACGKIGLASRNLRTWRKQDPAFEERLAAALDISLAQRRAVAETVVVDCMTQTADMQLALKAATTFLEMHCGLRRNADVQVNIAHVEETLAIVHVDMSEIRARAKENDDIAGLVYEVETAGAANGS